MASKASSTHYVTRQFKAGIETKASATSRAKLAEQTQHSGTRAAGGETLASEVKQRQARRAKSGSSAGLIGSAMMARPVGWSAADEIAMLIAEAVPALVHLPLCARVLELSAALEPINDLVNTRTAEVAASVGRPGGPGGRPRSSKMRNMWIAAMYAAANQAQEDGTLGWGGMKTVQANLGKIFGADGKPLSKRSIMDIAADESIKSMVDLAIQKSGAERDFARMVAEASDKFEDRSK